jgi:hypothetical protein
VPEPRAHAPFALSRARARRARPGFRSGARAADLGCAPRRWPEAPAEHPEPHPDDMGTPRKKKVEIRDDDEARKTTVLRPDEMPPEVIEFITAIDDYKRLNQRPFPTWSEVLEVLKGLGYQRQT